MKKAIANLICMAVLLSTVTTTAFAAKIDSFTDVPSNQWYYKAVSYCLENDLMNGQGDGIFNPGGVVSRAQIAQVLYNREGKKDVDLNANTFSDVNSEWFAKAVVWCSGNGIVNGTGDGNFAPGKSITRQDLCVMVYRYYKDYLGKDIVLAEESYMTGFTDYNKTPSYAREALRWAVKNSFMSGKTENTLAPGATCTRAELAQFLLNLDNLKIKDTSKPIPTPTPVPTPTPDPKPSGGLAVPDHFDLTGIATSADWTGDGVTINGLHYSVNLWPGDRWYIVDIFLVIPAANGGFVYFLPDNW